MGRESQYPHNFQWTAHWMQASSNSSSNFLQHCAVTDVGNGEDYIKGQRYLPVESTKSKEVKRFNIDLNHQYTFDCDNVLRPDAGRTDLTSFNYIRSVNSFGSEKLEKLPVQKPNVNWENFTTNHFPNSGSISSELEHFPMFDINRKMETVLGRKRKSGYGMIAARMNESFIDKEHFRNTQLRHLSHPTLMVSEMKNENEMTSGSFGSSWPRLKDGAMQVFKDSCPGVTTDPYLTGEHNSATENASGSRLLSSHKSIPRLRKSIDSGFLHRMSHKMPGCSVNDVEIPSSKGGPRKFSNASQYLLITKKMAMDLCQEDQMIRNSTVSSHVNGTTFFEVLTLPSIVHRHGQREENSQSLVSATDSEDKGDGQGIDTHSMEKENEPSVKTDTVSIDVSQTPTSLAGGTSKSQEIPMDDTNLKHPTYSDTAAFESNRELSISRTESMGADHILSPSGKQDKSNSNPSVETTFDSEPSTRWLKRLRHNPLNGLALSSKRIKMSYNRSTIDFPNFQQFGKTKLLLKDGEDCSEDSVKVIPWIRRWCHNSKEMSHPPPVLCEPENSKEPPEKFEGKQFPSIAAMAMIGKTMKNFRPCEFRRRGSSTVWNT